MNSGEKFDLQRWLEQSELPAVFWEEVRRYCSDLAANAGDLAVLGERGLPGLPRVWAYSAFVARACVRTPALLQDLLSSGDLERPYGEGEMAVRVHDACRDSADQAALDSSLRRLRRREMVRIAWRDLDGRASLDETLAELSDLADACVDAALDWHYAQICARHGQPRSSRGEVQRLVVLGMGKLGGRELNFSSDIDLIFAFPEQGMSDGTKPLENQEFFVRLGQRLIQSLSGITAEGFVFRVDMRLRPFGDAGPLVMGFEAMEDYYLVHGRDWERYAMIKARVIAGDREAGATLLKDLRPFVYRRYLDYGAFAALREMKALINRETARRGRVGDIKLGAGGIREIEFIGQAFQLIRGGRDPQLQRRGIRRVIALLVERALLPAFAGEQLLAAYDFLRRTENRLQMWQDQQTHNLPTEASGRLRLAVSMGFEDWAGFEKVLSDHMRRVHEHFDRVFEAPQTGTQGARGQTDLAALWAGEVEAPHAEQILAGQGYEDAERALLELKTLHEGRVARSLGKAGRARLDQLMPLLIAAAGGSEHPTETLTRLLRLIEAIARRSVYLALLVEHPLALSQLINLCAASPWVASHLAHHPVVLDELLDPRNLYAPPDRQGLGEALARELERVDPDDLEQLMERLRMFKQAQVLRVAAADLMHVLPLMRVSDQLTWIAEAELQAIVEIAWRDMTRRYGRPQCRIDGEPYHPGFAIIGYGKLGGIELGYGSDLDIVFVHDSAGEAQYTEGEKSLDNATFFARLGQRIIHILGTFTPAGILYDVDTRLRPSGASGMLVSSLVAFERYQHEDAWTWEHQALVRARAVAGERRLGEAFAAIREHVLRERRDPVALRREVREMREKMWQELGNKEPGRFDLKKDPGGIADIEFMVQYKVLAHACDYPVLTAYTDNIRILESLAESRLLPSADVHVLQEAYRVYRDMIHALTLQERPNVVEEGEYAGYREEVRRLWRELMHGGES